jgi:hypothetical protein
MVPLPLRQKVTVPTVAVPVPQQCYTNFNFANKQIKSV